ncbi:beta-glucosidase [Actinopolyspora mzabensis]|uniref:Beta-glucosidase n=1 Tax=Actinopolyspora mzabensis TaxID=995066 RepID=A0A1G8XQ75_ACTMZ|nr:glycoside hydrolase family 3 C-terminal domain-containing protein [Actinopolyspora mzabensis]SDJ92643.1 beta-glucosidase [Actinopolyspora mzabensis]
MTITELESRVDTAIACLDLSSKVALLNGSDFSDLPQNTSIGLSRMCFSDGPSGLGGRGHDDGGTTSLLPNATLLAQHWDVAAASEAGALLAEEAIAAGVHVLLGPSVNLHRTPLGGRVFDCFSEDPLLTGALATEYVRALQRRGVAACPKRFLANESEFERTTVDSVVDEKTLREVYLLPFEMLVRDASPWSVLTSPNRVNGIHATEHLQLLERLLKEEWRYEGALISDPSAASSVVAGTNPAPAPVVSAPDGPRGAGLLAAVRAGEVPESTIDEHLRRVLRLAERTGALDGESDPLGRSGSETLPHHRRPAADAPLRRRRLRALAAGGMTVLTNPAGVLPLSGTESLAVIGRHAVDTVAQGGGAARVRPPHVVSVADGLVAMFGSDRVSVVDGVDVRGGPSTRPESVRGPARGGIPGQAIRQAHATTAEITEWVARAAGDVDVAVVVVGLTTEQETEGRDKSTLALPGQQDAMVAAVAAAARRTVVVVNAATPVLMPWLDLVDAVLWAGLPGQEAGSAVAAALTGEIEPAGRLVTTFPARDGDGPAWSTCPVNGALVYQEGTAVGYRGWHRYAEVEPLFWFGHGLGYTTWHYESPALVRDLNAVRSVTVDVANTGPRAGTETVQVYLLPAANSEPVRLIGWTRVHVEAGRRTRVRVPCDLRAQRMRDVSSGSWRFLRGGRIMIGRGLGDVRTTLWWGPKSD